VNGGVIDTDISLPPYSKAPGCGFEDVCGHWNIKPSDILIELGGPKAKHRLQKILNVGELVGDRPIGETD